MKKEFHKFIANENDLQNFQNFLESEETYYFQLMSKKKWMLEQNIKKEKIHIKRLGMGKHIFSKIAQMECPIGAYSMDEIEYHKFGVYINPNPICGKSLWKEIYELVSFNVFHNTLEENSKIYWFDKIMSFYQNCDKSVLSHFDIDFEKKTNIDMELVYEFFKTKEIFGESAMVIETQNGFHILVKNIEATKVNAKWYPQIQNWAKANAHKFKEIVSPKGHMVLNGIYTEKSTQRMSLCPVPGCVQGDFVAKILY